MKHYMLCPVSGIELIDDLGTAKDLARKLAEGPQGQVAGGFAIFEVSEIGRFEIMSPIWVEPSLVPDPVRPFIPRDTGGGTGN